MKEEWLPMPNWTERYNVSSLGRVFSLVSDRLIKGSVLSTGYRVVRPKPGITVFIHHVVAEAFIGPRPPGQVVRHLDDDRSNNAVANLAYGTYSENSVDIIRLGNNPRVNRTHCIHGHQFTTENTYVTGAGHRQCRTCRSIRRREVWERTGK